jgi:uncharacterized protein YndB with AHSA1/START domain
MADSRADPRDVVTVERVIDAPAEEIFALLADPRRHRDFDGSGTVREAKVDDATIGDPGAGGAVPLTLGATFGMKMHLGVPYSMESTVVEYVENRRLAWQSRPPGFMGRLAGGRIWRYELEPVDDGRTRVRESWDLTQDRQKVLLRIGPTPKKTRASMEKTLERIDALLAPEG